MNLPFGFLQQQAAGGIGTLANGFGGSASSAACPGGINQACYAGQAHPGLRPELQACHGRPMELTFQQQLTNSLTFQIGYVGQRGAHLLNFEDIAQSIPLDAAGKIAGAGDPIVSRLPGPSSVAALQVRCTLRTTLISAAQETLRRNQHVEL